MRTAIEVAKSMGMAVLLVQPILLARFLKPPHALKVEDFQSVIQTNLVSAFLSLSMISKSMLRSGGRQACFYL